MSQLRLSACSLATSMLFMHSTLFGCTLVVNQTGTFTDTSSRKGSMEVAVWLHAETLINQHYIVEVVEVAQKATGWLMKVLACRLGNHYGYFHVTYFDGSGRESDSCG